MTTLKNCLSYMDVRGVQYAHTSHATAYTAADVAAAEHMPAHRVAKTVVFSGEGRHVFAVVPADTHVDIEQLRAATGIPTLKKSTEAELYMRFPNSEVGAMPPLGPLFAIPVYLDRELAVQQYIAFNAGTHRDLIHMRVTDFLAIVQPVLGDFNRREVGVSSAAGW